MSAPSHFAAELDRVLEPTTRAYYLNALRLVRESGVPFLLGGAYAFGTYTGIVRHTKDLDVFVRPDGASRVLEAFARAGYRTETTFPHWLGKAFNGDDFVDVIYNSGNGRCPVDDEWFGHARKAEVLGVAVSVIPAEEMIWQKSYIMERERYDGADVAHLLRACGPALDWDRLLRRFGPHWRVLLSHLVLFGFIYPAEQDTIPRRLLADLTGRLLADRGKGGHGRPVCQGTYLSRMQYLNDTERWGYQDARLEPRGPLSQEDITHWTAAAFEQK
jgi:hypothetical protein